MSYVTTLGTTVVARPTVQTSVPSQTPTKTRVTTKPAPSPAVTAANRMLTVTSRLQPRPSTPPVAPSIPDASLAPASNNMLLIAGGAVTVGLLLVIALRR